MMIDGKSGAVGRKMLPAVGKILAGFLFWEPALADTAAVVEKHVTTAIDVRQASQKEQEKIQTRKVREELLPFLAIVQTDLTRLVADLYLSCNIPDSAARQYEASLAQHRDTLSEKQVLERIKTIFRT